MISFHELLQNMNKNRLQEMEEQDSRSMEAIRSGINIREDFWDDFLRLINNAEALSELLEVPTTKISSWHSKINDMLSKVKDSDDSEVKTNNKMIDTSDDEDMSFDAT